MSNPETENSEAKEAKKEDDDKLDFNQIFTNIKNFLLNQFLLFAMTSFLFSIGTFIGGFIIQRKIEKKLITSMITYIPYMIFTAFYIISGVVHFISVLYGFFKTGWFLSLIIFLRLLAIVTGLFSIYLNYSKKDNLIHKIEDIWFQDSYALIVSYYQEYFGCCGWNTTTATCSYTRCYDFVNDQIDDIARMIGIASFVINTFQVGLCVDSILAVALQINVPQKSKKIDNSKDKNKGKEKIKEKDKKKDKDKSKDKNEDKKKDKNKDKDKAKGKNKENIKLYDDQDSSLEELDENATSVQFTGANLDSLPSTQENKNKQKNVDQNRIQPTLNETLTETNETNLSLNLSSSNLNTQSDIYESLPNDKNKSNKPKGKKTKENRNKKSNKFSSNEMDSELIRDSE